MLYLIETITLFKHSYAVEAASEKEARDFIAAGDKDDFAQDFLGENVITSMEITREQFLREFDKRAAYLASWDDELKLKQIWSVK